MSGARSQRRFLDIELPDRFILEVERERGGWIDYGIYNADVFARCEDGSYACTGTGWSPIFLRCIARDGDVITVVDGGGERFRYRIVPVDQAGA